MGVAMEDDDDDEELLVVVVEEEVVVRVSVVDDGVFFDSIFIFNAGQINSSSAPL